MSRGLLEFSGKWNRYFEYNFLEFDDCGLLLHLCSAAREMASFLEGKNSTETLCQGWRGDPA